MLHLYQRTESLLDAALLFVELFFFVSEHFHWFVFDLIEKEDDVACVPDDSESHFCLVVSFHFVQ